jgi:patatin-like phospholipase/acyl hydrolase
MARKYLLSIDGGGIRGIIPATALVKLEQITGKPVRETFSFVAGTSTGALVTAAIAAGVPAAEIVNTYLQRTKEIFSPGAPWNNLKRLTTGSMYSTNALNKVVTDTLGTARQWTLNDSPVDVLITAKRVSDGKPWYFVRDSAKNAGCTGGLRLTDCVTASAAAPTYFQPWTLPEPVGTLVDGGVGVTGNPVYQACVEAF